jgi:hypothetical protein
MSQKSENEEFKERVTTTNTNQQQKIDNWSESTKRSYTYPMSSPPLSSTIMEHRKQQHENNITNQTDKQQSTSSNNEDNNATNLKIDTSTTPPINISPPIPATKGENSYFSDNNTATSPTNSQTSSKSYNVNNPTPHDQSHQPPTQSNVQQQQTFDIMCQSFMQVLNQSRISSPTPATGGFKDDRDGYVRDSVESSESNPLAISPINKLILHLISNLPFANALSSASE